MNGNPGWLRNHYAFLSFGHWLALFLLLGAAPRVRSEIVFDNSANDLGRRFDPAGIEVGDQIVLAGTARYCTNFSFEYWGDSTVPGSFAGTVEVRVRFYRNDGPAYHDYAAPGTLFYDSGWLPVQPTLRNTLLFLQGADFPEGGLYLPEKELTWTVQFQGLGVGDTAGVDLYAPIVTGLGYDDYWENDLADGWTLKTNASAVVSFAARIEAQPGTPPAAPALQIAAAPGNVTLTWPAQATSFVLETSPALGQGAMWTRVTDGLAISNGFFMVTRSTSDGSRFFRLRQQ